MGELDALVLPLVDVYQFWKTLNFTVVFTGHCLFCATLAPQLKDKYLVHYLLTFLWGNGGGLLSALLLRSPERAPLSFFASNDIMVIWTICWWVVNYMPGGWAGSLQQRWYIKMWAKGCTSLLRALLIINRVDLAVTLFPGVVAAPLLLGTLGGCGGRLLADIILNTWGHGPPSAELSQPGYVSRSGFMAAATYYVAAYVLRLMPAQAVAGLVVTLLTAHSLLSDVLGHPLDWTEPLAQLVHTCSCVPAPGVQQQRQKPTSSKKPATPAGKAASAAAPASTGPSKSPAAVASPRPSKQRQRAVELAASTGPATGVIVAADLDAPGPRTRRRRAATYKD